jgi:hypothetical protein
MICSRLIRPVSSAFAITRPRYLHRLPFRASDCASGVRTDRSAMPDSVHTLRGRFAWAHDFNPDRSIDATFHARAGASFVVNGGPQAADAPLRFPSDSGS